jgi:hypothetical protein
MAFDGAGPDKLIGEPSASSMKAVNIAPNGNGFPPSYATLMINQLISQS